MKYKYIAPITEVIYVRFEHLLVNSQQKQNSGSGGNDDKPSTGALEAKPVNGWGDVGSSAWDNGFEEQSALWDDN